MQAAVDNNKELRQIKIKRQLSNPDLAKLLGVTPKAVESYLADPQSKNYRNMADRHMRLLKLELAASRKVAKNAKAKPSA
jgi:predicted transcriptional regulator